MSLLPLRFGGATTFTVASTFPHKLSPALADGMVARRRLFKRMEAASKAGVIAIIGPPASGKTFLAASWLCLDWVVQRTGRAIWYQADDADEDIAAFFQLVGSALAEQLRDNEEPLPAYTPEAFSQLKSFSAHWFRTLFKGGTRPPILFVIDDLHRLPADSPLAQVLLELAKALGPQDRLIFLSRVVLPSAIRRAIPRSRLVSITDLQVSENEWEDFAQASDRQEPLTREAFAASLRRSGYWIAGLDCLPQRTGILHASLDQIQSLLARLEASDRVALLATAFLQTGVEQDWATLGGPEAFPALLRLGAATRFVSRLSDTAFRKHELLSERLEAWAVQQMSPAALAAARASTGHLLIGRGELLAGLRLLIGAGALDDAQRVILDYATALIDRGKNQELHAIIGLLPATARQRPAIQIWHAYALLPFQPQAAAQQLATIRDRFAPQLTPQDLALAINGEIYAALANMIIDRRLATLVEAATELTDRLAEVAEPIRSRLILGRLIAILLGAPSQSNLAGVRQEATALLPRLTPESRFILGATLVNHLLWWHGDLAAARLLHAQFAPQAHRQDAPYLPVMSWYFGALGIAYRDADDKALRSLMSELDRFARRCGLRHRLGLAYWITTQAYAAAGDDAAAEAALKRHHDCIQSTGAAQLPEVHFLEGVVALSRNDLRRAVAKADAGRQSAESQGAIQALGQNAMLRATALALLGDDAARTSIQELLRLSALTGNKVTTLQAALAAACLAHAKQHWDEFRALWSDVTRQAEALGVRRVSVVSPDVLGRLARDALQHDVDPAGTVHLIQLWRIPTPAGEPIHPAWPFPVEINCLGPFEVKLGSEPKRLGTRKTPRRPLDLLKHLATASYDGLPQQQLAEEVWPGADADRAIERLQSAVYRLRTLIGAEAILFEKDAFRLNEKRVITDTHRLEEMIRVFSDARRDRDERKAAFDRAIQLYRGPLLPGATQARIAALRDDIAKRFKRQGERYLDAIAPGTPESMVQRERLAALFRT
jgi:LuxR family transcriptional regulator, maltose regulon positive regulatory protein